LVFSLVEEIVPYAEAYISTEQPPPGQDARLQGEDGDEKRPSGAEASPRQGAQEADALALLRRVAPLPRSNKIRKSSEFRVVYESGRRYDGLLMTAFVHPNDCREHRLGVTVSRKISKAAVGRNRLKRLLREAFRLSQPSLSGLGETYDWVLNARRSMLEVKLAPALEDFQKIVERASRGEGRTRREDGRSQP
jgi:ribonuclease P protein component